MLTPRRRLVVRGLVVIILFLGIALFVLWRTPSSDYLFVPAGVRAVDPLVTVPNEHEGGSSSGPGIYMVDIYVRRASLLERIFPGSDATLVSEKALNPVGVSDQEQRRIDALDMSRSQQVATLVALRALGYKVNVHEDGALVDLVVPNSPAAKAGLEPGDRIVQVNGAPVATPQELRGALAGITPGASVRVGIRRSGALRTVVVGTESASDNPRRAVIGVIVEAAVSYDAPIKVQIDAGQVVGPSAGLAFALDIVDELGPDLVKHRRIVATGELEPDGSVHPIGGIKQKAISARDAHADLFLVPAGQAAEARKYAGPVKVEPVATFAEALRDLGVAARAA